jgi:hypothetical protein
LAPGVNINPVHDPNSIPDSLPPKNLSFIADENSDRKLITRCSYGVIVYGRKFGNDSNILDFSGMV